MRKWKLAALVLVASGCGKEEQPQAPRPIAPVQADPAPEVVELETGLELAIIDADFRQCPVREAIQRIAREAGLKRVVFPASSGGRAEEEVPVNLEAQEISANSALRIVLFPRHLTWRAGEDVLTVERAAADPPGVTREIHDVRHLVQEDTAVARPGSEPLDGGALLDLLRDAVGAEAWDAGLEIEYREGGFLLVKAPVDVQRAVREALEDLRRRMG